MEKPEDYDIDKDMEGYEEPDESEIGTSNLNNLGVIQTIHTNATMLS